MVGEGGTERVGGGFVTQRLGVCGDDDDVLELAPAEWAEG